MALEKIIRKAQCDEADLRPSFGFYQWLDKLLFWYFNCHNLCIIINEVIINAPWAGWGRILLWMSHTWKAAPTQNSMVDYLGNLKNNSWKLLLLLKFPSLHPRVSTQTCILYGTSNTLTYFPQNWLWRSSGLLWLVTPGTGEAGTGTDQGAGQSEKPISKLGRQIESIFWAIWCPQK